ncbi:reverse transcriptase [Gossypium australe]|uniref:Reverse transcriptase n=1 Tax=Gossypium australe TaxID=47621 RepID=A0A5B6VUD5_9ROSI|nr:reverse transcriptase [Gossypium australe]
MWLVDAKKSLFKILKRRFTPKLKDGAPEYYHKEVRKYSLNQYFRLYQPMLNPVFSYQSLYVKKLKGLLLNSGGKKHKGEKEFIGASGSIWSMAQVNVSLLAKQGWILLNNPNLLVAQVLQEKYFSNESFLNSLLGNNSLCIWKSIWAAKGILAESLCWKVGRGTEISVINDVWIPDARNSRLSSFVNNLSDFKVAEIVDASSRKWKKELISSIFPEDVAKKILRISLAKRNKRIHEKANRSGKEIASFINSYISELNGIGEKTAKILLEVRKWKHPSGQFVKINFDATYDGNLCQSAVGIVAKDSEGNVLLSYSEIHQQVASAFAAVGIDMQWQKLIIEAHTLATETLKKKDEIYLVGNVPEYAENLKEKEKVREPD